jgi:serine/threonine-protein kinase
LWSQRYDRDLSDVFALQDEIAGAITASLRVKLGNRSNTHIPNPEAHEALLKGRHHVFKLTKEGFGLAGEYFHKAVQLDANYAAAHAWLGFYWMVTSAGYMMPAREAMARARTAALRAVELEPSSADAHAVLCAIAAQLDYDWAEAGRRFRLATCAPAVSPEAHRMCAFNYLLSAGRPLDAAHECELALRQDPLNDFAALQLGVCLHASGDTRAAFDCYRPSSSTTETSSPT